MSLAQYPSLRHRRRKASSCVRSFAEQNPDHAAETGAAVFLWLRRLSGAFFGYVRRSWIESFGGLFISGRGIDHYCTRSMSPFSGGGEGSRPTFRFLPLVSAASSSHLSLHLRTRLLWRKTREISDIQWTDTTAVITRSHVKICPLGPVWEDQQPHFLF